MFASEIIPFLSVIIISQKSDKILSQTDTVAAVLKTAFLKAFPPTKAITRLPLFPFSQEMNAYDRYDSRNKQDH